MYLLLVSQIQKGVLLPFPLDILFVPSFLLNHDLQCGPLLLVQPEIDASQKEANYELRRKQNHDGNVARNIRGRSLGLENLRSDDVTCGKGCERNGVDRRLLGMSSGVGRVIRVDNCKG